MNIGIRAHDLGSFGSVEEMADAVVSAELDSIQLVAWKALDKVSRSPSLWTARLVRDLREHVIGRGIGIPLVGAYFNWFSTEELRGGGTGRQLFRESLAAAGSIGATAVGTEVEGFSRLPLWNSRRNLADDNMDHAVAVAGDLQETALEADTLVGIEGVWFHVLNTPEKVGELKKRSGADRIRYIFDPVNFLNVTNWRRQEELIDRAVELYGGDMMMVHCKDFIPGPGVLLPVSPGRGRFNYPYLISALKSAGLSDIPFILEGVRGSDIPRSRDYLRNLGNR